MKDPDTRRVFHFTHLYTCITPAAHAAKPSLAFVNKRREGFNTTRPISHPPLVTDDENQKYLKRARQEQGMNFQAVPYAAELLQFNGL